MNEDGLESLVDGLEDRVRWSGAGEQSGATTGTVVVVSCLLSRCESDASLWPAGPSWDARAVATLGNQTWEHREGRRVVGDTLAHLTSEHDVRAVLVVGHTECDVVADAYERWVAPDDHAPAGTAARLRPLVSVVDDAAAAGVVDASTPLRTARSRLVEYNVVRQAAFLRARLSPPVAVVGYVRDQDGTYGSFPGKQYLVTVDGETDDDEIGALLPDDVSTPVASLLS